ALRAGPVHVAVAVLLAPATRVIAEDVALTDGAPLVPLFVAETRVNVTVPAGAPSVALPVMVAVNVCVEPSATLFAEDVTEAVALAATVTVVVSWLES